MTRIVFFETSVFMGKKRNKRNDRSGRKTAKRVNTASHSSGKRRQLMHIAHTLKIRKIPVSTGGPAIALVTRGDARMFSLRPGDRVLIRNGRKSDIFIIDFTRPGHMLRSGEIGLFDESSKILGAENGQRITLSAAQKPRAIFHIQKKLHGGVLSRDEIRDIVRSLVKNELTDIELTYFVAASYLRELCDQEVVDLTLAMLETGKKFTYHAKKPIVDKHCIGGVAANRTTALVIPIVAAAGYTMPKTSSRSITSPAGTADTMEVLMNVSLPLPKMKRVMESVHACMVWGGALDLAPADDKIIHIEHPMSLDPVGQLIASILAKKKSVNASHVLIDIPVGKGAKIEHIAKAKILKTKFERIGRKLGMIVRVVISDGSQPIGNGIGPGLEARDILWTIQNDPRGSKQLAQKAIEMSGLIFNLVGKCSVARGEKLACELLSSGAAYKKFMQIIRAQGAVERHLNADKIAEGRYQFVVRSPKNGRISHMDNKILSRIAKLAGAPMDWQAGIYLHVHKNFTVKKREPLFTIHAQHLDKLAVAKSYARKDLGIIID